MTAVYIDTLATLPALVWLVVVLLRWRSGASVTAAVRAGVLAVAVSYVLAHVNRWLDLWKSHPYFPSGHETFASCMCALLVALDRRFLVPSMLVLALLGYSLVRSGWHGRFEVVGGFVLGAGVAACALQVNRAR